MAGKAHNSETVHKEPPIIKQSCKITLKSTPQMIYFSTSGELACLSPAA
ncbi:hypothetical protein M2311_000276 [Rhizobium leguminosarum]|nr:hypothetical protein [Rhizobium leguminosarum]